MKECRISITEQDIEQYAKVSGDDNPIHLDEAYAKSHGYSNKIAHGMLTMAKVWSVLSNELLAPNELPKEYELTFLSPVHVGDVVVLQIEQAAKKIKVKGICDGKTVVTGSVFV